MIHRQLPRSHGRLRNPICIARLHVYMGDHEQGNGQSHPEQNPPSFRSLLGQNPRYGRPSLLPIITTRISFVYRKQK